MPVNYSELIKFKIFKKNVIIIFMKNEFETIILGAGISGIGCTKTLLDNNYKNFKIISPDVGGRILESKNDQVEYGAYYMMNNYYNTKFFLDIKRKIKISDLMFHKNKKKYKFNIKKLFFLFIQLFKFIFILIKFKKYYEKFKKECEYKSQVECLKKDKYLWKLYHTQTEDFIKENNLHDIFYDYMAEVLHSSGFVPIKKLNAFTLLHFSLPLILPTYEFNFDKKKAEQILEKNLIEDSVIKIEKIEDIYKIDTEKNKSYYCKNLISALPPHIAKKIIGFKDNLREPVSAYMTHLTGNIKGNWSDARYNLFDDNDPVLALASQKDGSYLFYSRNKNIDLNNYFENYSIIKEKFWNPAFNIGGSNLVNFKQGENLYVIGDNNVCGLEDSYIYGICAANKILGKNNN
jgi:hypothetical protein